MKREKKKSNLVLIILSMVCLIGGLLLWQMYPRSPHQNFSKHKLTEDSHAVGYNPGMKKPKNFDSKQVALPGFSEVDVKKGDTNAQIALANPSFNQVYLSYKVTFDQTGEVLLDTGLISPGKAIKTLPLPKDLDTGTYPLTISIKTYDLKNQSELNGGSNNTSLIVE